MHDRNIDLSLPFLLHLLLRELLQLLPTVFQGYPSGFALCMSHFSPGAQVPCWSAAYFTKIQYLCQFKRLLDPSQLYVGCSPPFLKSSFLVELVDVAPEAEHHAPFLCRMLFAVEASISEPPWWVEFCLCWESPLFPAISWLSICHNLTEIQTLSICM